MANWADSILRVTREDNPIRLSLQWEKTKNAFKEVSNVNLEVSQDLLKFMVR